MEKGMIIKVNSNFQEKKQNSKEAQIRRENPLKENLGSFFAKLDERKKKERRNGFKNVWSFK